MQSDHAILDALKQRQHFCYVGMETDLIFTQQVDLPEFAAFPLLETKHGRSLLRGYYDRQITLAGRNRAGVILESATWLANCDRGRKVGYTPTTLVTANQNAMALMAAARSDAGYDHVLLSANVGPAQDAYASQATLTRSQAVEYHSAQIGTLAQTEADLISGYTLAYSDEAAGIAQAARKFGLPSVIAFTVETDGCLPSGQHLQDAITEVDHATGSAPMYYMVNCAHPSHFLHVLDGGDWMERLGGIVANASSRSHAELDNAPELDAGDPVALAAQLAAIKARFPQILVLGGCCGTDMRHLEQILEQAR